MLLALHVYCSTFFASIPMPSTPATLLPLSQYHYSGTHNWQAENSLTSLTGEQKSYGTSAAPQKYLQQGEGGVGHAIALAAPRGGQLVVVKQEQALEMRVGPHVATGLGAGIVL